MSVNVEDLIKESKRLYKDQQFGRAVNLLLANYLDNRYVNYELAKNLIKTSDFETALVYVDKVIQSKKDWLGAYEVKLLILVNLSDKLGFLNAFTDVFFHCQHLSETSEIKNFFSRVYNNFVFSPKSIDKDFLLFKKIFFLHRASFPQHFQIVDFFEGLVAWKIGEIEHAIKKISAIDKNAVEYLGRHSTGALSMVEKSKINDYVKKSNQSFFGLFAKHNPKKIDFSTFEKVPFDDVVFSACDAKYFLKFGELFVASAYQASHKAIIHIHIVNPNQDVYDLCGIIKKSCGDRVFFSFELNALDKKIYYASVRFFLIPDLMNFYKKPIFVCDIDALFTGSVNQFLPNWKSFDFVIKGSQERSSYYFYPWRQIAIGFLWINYTPQSLIYFDAFSRVLHMKVFEAKDDAYWYMDQSVMISMMKSDFINVTFKMVRGETTKVVIYPDASDAINGRDSKEGFVANRRNAVKYPWDTNKF